MQTSFCAGLAELPKAGEPAAAMKYIDEFRDPRAGRGPGRADPARSGRGRCASWSSAAGTPMPSCATACAAAAPAGRAGLRPRLPGVRQRRRGPGPRHRAGRRARRGPGHLRRHDAGARHAASSLQERQGRGRRRARGLFRPRRRWSSRARTRTARWSSWASASRPPRPTIAASRAAGAGEGLRQLLRPVAAQAHAAGHGAILDAGEVRLDGFLGPGHVSAIIGCDAWEFLPPDYGVAVRRRGLRAGGHPAGRRRAGARRPRAAGPRWTTPTRAR